MLRVLCVFYVILLLAGTHTVVAYYSEWLKDMYDIAEIHHESKTSFPKFGKRVKKKRDNNLLFLPSAVILTPDYGDPSGDYLFGYQIQDEKTNNFQARVEKRTNGVVEGEYRVLQPTGRLQIVRFTADKHGFRPAVWYKDGDDIFDSDDD